MHLFDLLNRIYIITTAQVLHHTEREAGRLVYVLTLALLALLILERLSWLSEALHPVEDALLLPVKTLDVGE